MHNPVKGVRIHSDHGAWQFGSFFRNFGQNTRNIITAELVKALHIHAAHPKHAGPELCDAAVTQLKRSASPCRHITIACTVNDNAGPYRRTTTFVLDHNGIDDPAVDHHIRNPGVKKSLQSREFGYFVRHPFGRRRIIRQGGCLRPPAWFSDTIYGFQPVCEFGIDAANNEYQGIGSYRPGTAKTAQRHRRYRSTKKSPTFNQHHRRTAARCGARRGDTCCSASDHQHIRFRNNGNRLFKSERVSHTASKTFLFCTGTSIRRPVSFANRCAPEKSTRRRRDSPCLYLASEPSLARIWPAPVFSVNICSVPNLSTRSTMAGYPSSAGCTNSGLMPNVTGPSCSPAPASQPLLPSKPNELNSTTPSATF